MVEKYHPNPLLGNDKAMQGDARAQYILSKEIYRTAKTQDDYKKAFKSFKKAADQGDAQAQFNLALMHELVWQIVDNYDQTTYDDKKRTEVYIQQTKSALYWMKKSADEGCKFVHFADLDFFGIEHFSSINESLCDSVDLWNSPLIDLDYYRKHGDKELFEKQKTEANLKKIEKTITGSNNAREIFENITKSGFCIHQELIHSLFFD